MISLCLQIYTVSTIRANIFGANFPCYLQRLYLQALARSKIQTAPLCAARALVVEAFGWTEFQSVFSGRPPAASLNNATDDGAPPAFATFFVVLRNRLFRALLVVCCVLVLLPCC